MLSAAVKCREVEVLLEHLGVTNNPTARTLTPDAAAVLEHPEHGAEQARAKPIMIT